MPAPKKVPITEVGRIYQLRENHGVNLCVVCASHKYIIVQKFGSVYGIHTYMARGAAGFCHHSWSNRQSDPPCLAAYEPTDRLVTYGVNCGVLQAGMMYGGYKLGKVLREDIPQEPAVQWRDVYARRPQRRAVPNIVEEE